MNIIHVNLRELNSAQNYFFSLKASDVLSIISLSMKQESQALIFLERKKKKKQPTHSSEILVVIYIY